MEDASLAARFKFDPETVPVKLSKCHSKLLSARGSRVRPSTDDKILTAWNGLMLAAVAEASRVIASYEMAKQSSHDVEIASLLSLFVPHNDAYHKLATRNAKFLLSALRTDGRLHRAWRGGKTTNEAALILGLIELYQTDFDPQWFVSAQELTDEMIQRFSDPSGGFFDTPNDGEQLLIRPKDVQDNATPSGNALACEALLKLANFTDKGEYRDLAEKSLAMIGDVAARFPTGFAHWLSAAESALGSTKQVAVVGDADDPSFGEMIRFLRSEYRPNMIVAASSYPPPNEAPPLLHDRPMRDGKTTVYVCEGFVCRQPVTSIEELSRQL